MAKNAIHTRETTQYPNNLVQLLRAGKYYRQEPYYDNGVLIVEFSQLHDVLEEICVIVDAAKEEQELQSKRLRRFEKQYLNPPKKLQEQFLDDKKSRQKLLKFLNDNNTVFINGFLEFFTKTNELAWDRASVKNAFHRYDEYLKVLLDVIETLDVRTSPPALIEMISYNLNRLAFRLGVESGDAHAAFKTWKTRAPKLSNSIIREMKNISLTLRYDRLFELLEEHTNPVEA